MTRENGNSKQFGQTVFLCGLCAAIFDTQLDLREHEEETHPNETNSIVVQREPIKRG
jgi:hypothetical protein